VYDPTVWLGTYTATGCDQTQCCCALSSTISASSDGATYTVAATNLQGQCGNTPSTSTVSVSVPAPTSDSGVTYTTNGQTHMASRQSGGTILDQNESSATCNGILTKTASPQQQVTSACAFVAPGGVLLLLLVTICAALF
jgi:hypothetical protein